MDYEKAYKEALERAKNIESLDREYITPKEAIEYLFPQLKESEDEKIRKWIYNYIERVGKTWGKQPITYTQILAWLEKQKPLEWSEEDEDYRQMIIKDLERIKSKASVEEYKGFLNQEIEWLKSLKPQNRWKPSSQHIAALEYQVNSTCKGSWQYNDSKELLEQLKKL